MSRDWRSRYSTLCQPLGERLFLPADFRQIDPLPRGTAHGRMSWPRRTTEGRHRVYRRYLGTAGHTRIRRWLSTLMDTVYPPHCVVCGRLGAWVCDGCTADIAVFRAPLCRQCGKSIDAPGVCSECRAEESYLAGMCAVGPHRPPLQQIIHAFKYTGVRVLSGPLGALLEDRWRRDRLPIDGIVPVPLHSARQRQRGYNQSILLADELGARLGLPVHPELLVRARNTRSQVGLSGGERWANVWGAFRCPTDQFPGTRLLLIDDVMTSGATLQACAHALRERGAASVWALTLTRAMAPAIVRNGQQPTRPLP